MLNWDEIIPSLRSARLERVMARRPESPTAGGVDWVPCYGYRGLSLAQGQGVETAYVERVILYDGIPLENGGN